MCNPTLCYPPLHYCWGRCCPFYFIRMAALSSTVPTPPTILLGHILPVFNTVDGAILSSTTLLPLLYYFYGRCCPLSVRLAAQSSTVLPPYTTVGADAARFFPTVGCAILYCATSLYYHHQGRCRPFFLTVGCAILYCATPPLHYC